jgi:hypothetical protein
MYVFSLLYCIFDTFEKRYANGSSYPRIKCDDIINIKIPIPKTKEKLEYWINKIGSVYNINMTNEQDKIFKEYLEELKNDAIKGEKLIDEECNDENIEENVEENNEELSPKILEKCSKQELMKICDDKKYKYKKSYTTDKLISIIKNEGQVGGSGDTTFSEIIENNTSNKELEKMNVNELKEECKKRGIKGYSKLNKKELLEKLK